jgi:amino acid transporter
MSVMCIPLVVSLLVFGLKMMKNSKTLFKTNDSDVQEVVCIISFVIAVILTIVGCISIPINGYDAFLAYTNPEMFTIQQVIEKVKQ